MSGSHSESQKESDLTMASKARPRQTLSVLQAPEVSELASEATLRDCLAAAKEPKEQRMSASRGMAVFPRLLGWLTFAR